MEKYQLAQGLRQRQYERGLISPQIINIISDDDIINSYITCSCCGEKQVTSIELEAAIRQAFDTYHFLVICDERARAASRGHIQLPPADASIHQQYFQKRLR